MTAASLKTSITVSDDVIPTWMKTKSSVKKPTNKFLDLVQNRRRLDIELVWKRKGGPQEERAALQQHLDEEGLDLPSTRQQCHADHRDLSGQQYRDSIRRQFDCRRLGTQLSAVTAVIEGLDEDDEDEILDLLKNSAWKFVQERLNKTSVGRNVRVEFRMRVLDTESKEELFESRDPPKEVEELYTMDDGITSQ